MNRLVRAELLKIRTTRTWWLFALGVLGFTALALLVNCVQAHMYLHHSAPVPTGAGADQARAQIEARADVTGQAANIYTSGQYFGLLLTLLLGILLVTNEYHHQMATTTFLVTPLRTRVIAAKFLAAVLIGAGFWLLALLPSLLTGVLFLRWEHLPAHLGDWPVWRAILLNLAAYAVWAVFGVGFGVLIRSQVAAVVTGAVLYLVGTQAAQAVFFLVYTFLIKKDWVLTSMVVVPSVASQVMISVVKLYPQSPAQWVGAAVLLGYGFVAGVFGVLLTRKRDIG
jgi:ABC-2 type transport system permease protein